MHICYDPDTLKVRHIITIGFADCHLSDGAKWLKVDGFMPPHELNLERGDGGDIVVRRGTEQVRALPVRSAAEDFPAPPRTLTEVRQVALEILARRQAGMVAGAADASAYYRRKEGWARDHLAGNKAHPIIGAEAVEKRIACHELCQRIIARADALRAQRESTAAEASRIIDRAVRVIAACQSIEEIDDYMAHFG